MGNVLGKVQEFTGPIGEFLDVLVQPIPGLSDLAGQDITLLER